MRQAWVARPEWNPPLGPGFTDARLRAMPLQQLELLEPQAALLGQLQSAASAWLVFTSPASVQAFGQWSDQSGIHLLSDSRLRIAALGAGTRDQLLREASLHQLASNSWRVAAEKILIAEGAERADAQGLLLAFDQLAAREAMPWANQTLLLAEAEGNRPLLADGLTARGAQVLVAPMYRRVDVQWPASVWSELRGSAAEEIAVVVTSSSMAARLVEGFGNHHLARTQVVWCTHHVSIAKALQTLGVAKVRRVRLEEKDLIEDLFAHESNW